MLSLSRSLGRISISSVSRVPTVRPLSTSLAKEISTSNELERGRRDLTFFLEEGKMVPRKRAWKYGTGSSKAWNCYKPGVGKLAAGRQRTLQFGKDASLSMRVEDLPMMWQMRPMTKEERERFKDEPRFDSCFFLFYYFNHFKHTFVARKYDRAWFRKSGQE